MPSLDGALAQRDMSFSRLETLGPVLEEAERSVPQLRESGHDGVGG